MARTEEEKFAAQLEKNAQSKKAQEKLTGLAETLYNQFQQGIVPHITLPSRTKGNIEFSTKDDVWVYGDQETMRSVKTVRGAKTLLKTVHLTELLIKEHLKNNRGSTLREIYYISENWDIAKFHEQAESDRLIEDLEIVTDSAPGGFSRPAGGGRRSSIRAAAPERADAARRARDALPGGCGRGRLPDTLQRG